MAANFFENAYLPTEILLSLLPFLEIQDLKSFRRCNKFFAKEGARILFHTLVVFFKRSSFDRFLKLSYHKDLRLHVHRIDYVPNRFVPNMSMDQWRHHYSQHGRDQFNAVVWLRKPYEEYLSLSFEQWHLTLTYYPFFVWKDALGKFPNLLDFGVLMQEAQKPDHGLLHSIIKRTYCEPDAEYQTRTYHTDLRLSQPVVSVLVPLLDLHRTMWGTHSLPPSLHVLHLEGIDRRTLSYLAAMSTAGLSSCLNNLRDLTVSFIDPSGRGYVDHTERHALRTILVAAQNLAKVRVGTLERHFHLKLTDIFDPGHTWQNLGQVGLQQVTLDLGELISFIRSHQSSLRQLSFTMNEQPSNQPASWEVCLDYMHWALDRDSVSGTTELRDVFESASLHMCPEKSGLLTLTAIWN